MKRTSTNSGTVRTALGRAAPVAFAIIAAAALWLRPAWSTPLAGTTLGNQASARYTDASLTDRTATSNTVVTVVAQVSALTLTVDGVTKPAAPGSSVVFPHTLTNTGNGTDNFDLSLADGGADYSFGSLAIYADENGDGVPDNSTPITVTGNLAPGAIFRFVVSGIIPGGLSSGNGEMVITATSKLDVTATADNTDTAAVTANAVVNVTKAISATSGLSPSGPYTVTFTYTNTGNKTATELRIGDVLPTGMTYVADSGHWSVTPTDNFTNAVSTYGTTPNTICYDYSGSSVTAVIAQVLPGFSGVLTFRVNIAAGLATQTLLNTGAYRYHDGSANTSLMNTNTVGFKVLQTAAVSITGEVIASAVQGAIVTFTNTVTNNGNGTDAFDITYENDSFPAGTTFVLYQSDGYTPLSDTNGNGVADTGPMARNTTYNVVLKAILPPGSSAGGPYTVHKTARSVFDPTKTDTDDDTLTTIAANTVDLTNDDSLYDNPTAPGYDPGTGDVIDTISTDPGATVRFTLVVNNTSGIADTYDMTATGLPPGWAVTFRNKSGTVITNTGVVNASTSTLVYADVTIPANFAPGDHELTFRSISPTSAAGDYLVDQVTVQTVRSIKVTPNNAGQVFPGGSVVYTHVLSNVGNVLEGDGTVSSVGLASADGAGWSSVVYLDSNSNNVLDPGDTLVTTLTTVSLAPGASQVLFVKVFAPAGAAVGSQNPTVMTVTTENGTYTLPVPPAVTATNTSSVIGGQVRLEKVQTLDADCDGDTTPDAAFSAADIISGAKPTTCIRYQITATNDGSTDVTGLFIDDATPPNTKYETSCGAAAVTVGTVPVKPADGFAGAISADVGTLTPHASAVLTFGVKIND